MPTKAPSEPMSSSPPWRTAAPTATLTGALPVIFCRSLAGSAPKSSKQGTPTTRAGTPPAEPDRIMVNHRDEGWAQEGGQANGGREIIREAKKGAREGNDPAVQCHAVHGRRHAVLAHPIMDETSPIVSGRQDRHASRLGVVGAGQIGRAADHFRQRRRQCVERVLRRMAGGGFLRRCP